MIGYNKRVLELLPEYEKSVDEFINGYSGYINWFTPDTEEGQEQAVALRDSIESMLTGTKSGLDGTQGFYNSILGLKGISRDINSARVSVMKTLRRIVSTLERIESFCLKSLNILDEKISATKS
jgi:hypothetical protein